MSHVPPPDYDGAVHFVRDLAGVHVTRADPFVQIAESALPFTTWDAETQTLHLPDGVAYRLHSYDADLRIYKADRIDA